MGVNNPNIAGEFPIEFKVYDGAVISAANLIKHETLFVTIDPKDLTIQAYPLALDFGL